MPGVSNAGRGAGKRRRGGVSDHGNGTHATVAGRRVLQCDAIAAGPLQVFLERIVVMADRAKGGWITKQVSATHGVCHLGGLLCSHTIECCWAASTRTPQQEPRAAWSSPCISDAAQQQQHNDVIPAACCNAKPWTVAYMSAVAFQAMGSVVRSPSVKVKVPPMPSASVLGRSETSYCSCSYGPSMSKLQR